MATLNDRQTISDLEASDRRGLGPTVRKVRIAQNTRLYKFTEYGTFGGGKITPWWAFVEPFTLDGTHNDPGLDGHILAARQAGMSMLAYARRVFAIMFEWNSLSAPAVGLARVQHMTLRVAAYAFVAAGASMPAYKRDPLAEDSALEHARAARYSSELTSKQKHHTEAMWKQKAVAEVGTDLLPGGAIQICLKNLTAEHVRVGTIQLLS